MTRNYFKMENLYQVAILENNPLFGNGLKSILDETGEFSVAAISGNIDKLESMMNKNMPDVVILGISHIETDGIEAIKRIKQSFKNLPILSISNSGSSDYFIAQIKAGINGLLLENTSPCELTQALHRLCNGENHFRKNVLKLLTLPNEPEKKEDEAIDSKNALTAREIDVLKLFCEGFKYKEIADKLKISPRTVESHKNNILAKLNVNSTVDLVKYAIKHSFIELS